MNPIEKGLAAALLAAMASFGFANCVEIKGSEYKVFCCGDRDYYFYSASIYKKKIYWEDHIKAEKDGLRLSCTACHRIHS
ncbi:hypothetical protein HYT92_03485 [Candidatus Pacearchaeota archaeon]|nr:hypothetical protein [Candidatus Pacearchaeota archaeon]